MGGGLSGNKSPRLPPCLLFSKQKHYAIAMLPNEEIFFQKAKDGLDKKIIAID
jgi:hypothetical protein